MFKLNPTKKNETCYVTIGTTNPTETAEMLKTSVLNHEFDRYFSSNITKDRPNMYFNLRCKIYDDLMEAARFSSNQSKTPSHVLIFEMNYGRVKVEQLAAAGKFSSGIKTVYNCDEILSKTINPF